MGLLVFGLPVVMFWMIALDSRFTDSTMTGIAIVRLQRGWCLLLMLLLVLLLRARAGGVKDE